MKQFEARDIKKNIKNTYDIQEGHGLTQIDVANYAAGNGDKSRERNVRYDVKDSFEYSQSVKLNSADNTG